MSNSGYGFRKTVASKKELNSAVKDGYSEIVVVGKLAKKMKPITKLKNLSPKEKAAVVAFATVMAGTVAVSLVAAPATAGLSVPISYAIAIPAEAAAAGLSGGTIAVIVGLFGAIGIALFGILKDYDVKYEVDMGMARVTLSKR